MATDLFVMDRRGDMMQAIETCIDMASEDSGGPLTPGCEVPGIATPESVDCFMELVDDSGSVEDARPGEICPTLTERSWTSKKSYPSPGN